MIEVSGVRRSCETTEMSSSFRARGEQSTAARGRPATLRHLDEPAALVRARATRVVVERELDTGDGGRVDVSVVGGEDEVVVRVSDTGRGIEAADQQHLFERFFRAPDSEGLPGAGLGLSIVKAIVDAHGGTVRVESRAGPGTTFEVRFRRGGPPATVAAVAA
jgi:signal transduction histidine kinase